MQRFAASCSLSLGMTLLTPGLANTSDTLWRLRETKPVAGLAMKLRPANGKGGPRGLSDTQLVEALRKNGGNILAAAQALGVTDSAIYQRLSNHPELKAIQLEASSRVTELAKARVIKRIERDDWNGINLWLTTQGGWTKRSELTGADGAPLPAAVVNIQVTYVDARKDEEDVL